jgi:hypothetical protein
MKKPDATRMIDGQPSWRIASQATEAFVAETGGHLAPVRFHLPGGTVQPFAIAPWHKETLPKAVPPILRVLRGDFFCMPFGGNATKFGKEAHPPHGETANRNWTCLGTETSDGRSTLRLKMKTRVRKAAVDREISVAENQWAVYSRTVIRGGDGPMSFGHHATLKFPDRPGSGVVTTSPIHFGRVAPLPVELPEEKGYSILKPGARFRTLDRVPTITDEMADLSRYPARRGYEDIAILVSKPGRFFAWTAVTFPEEGYVWFTLKDARVLRQTLMWMSNGGRHFPPWNGRHVNVLGLEEVTSYFHYGLAESAAPNPLSEAGFPTTAMLDPLHPLTVNTIMAVAPVSKGFDKVADILPADQAGHLSIISASGKRVIVSLDWEFLRGTAGPG